MHRNQALYAFLMDNIPTLTEAWYASLSKEKRNGIYSSHNPRVVEKLKQHNYEFHRHFCEIFILSEQDFKTNFRPWIKEMVQDVTYYQTPFHLIIQEFMRNRELYFSLLDTYTSQHEDVSQNLERIWMKLITRMFDDVICTIAEEADQAAQVRLKAQRELINELSAPVISLKDCDISLLPLIGTVDEERAKIILEATLEQCIMMKIKKLYIDLSGTSIVSSLVCHHLDKLIAALRIIGIETVLCGMRAEFAQDATQLGFVFEGVEIRSSLSQALSIHS
ncbi:STAS domain-containing protein [Priestia koreensis]|uniref:STAS domain-containing protein n=1 Tax=Priestia koreensis TaxID=284581 RepID=UPI003CFC7C67